MGGGREVKNSLQLKSAGSLNYLWLNSSYALCVCVCVCVPHTFALAEDNYDIWLRTFMLHLEFFLTLQVHLWNFFSIYENI